MPRLSLKVVGNHLCRCNDSSPRYRRENHYAISRTVLEFPTFSNYKISITLLIFPKCRGLTYTNPITKLQILFDSDDILSDKIQENSGNK